MVLRTTEKPDSVQHGGGQMLAINTFLGGNVSIQNFGSTYREISWEGWFEGTDAMERMVQIGNMRQKGEVIDFVTEAYTQKVVIQEFQPEHRTNFFIPFSITLQRVVQITKPTPKEAADKTAEDIKTEEEKNKQQNGQEYYVYNNAYYRNNNCSCSLRMFLCHFIPPFSSILWRMIKIL